MKPATELIDGHYDPKHARNAVKMPLYLSSNYVFSSAEEAKKLFEQKGVQPADQDHAAPQDMIYSRLGHPNLRLTKEPNRPCFLKVEWPPLALCLWGCLGRVTLFFIPLLCMEDRITC
jgi:hypothetical protein